MITELLQRPLFSLTVEEFLEISKTVQGTEKPIEVLVNKAAPTKPEAIRGINGLAEFLACTVPTAQKLKNSGKIPYSQYGRLILFDPEKVMAALAANPKKR